MTYIGRRCDFDQNVFFPPNPIRSGPVRPDPMWSGKITMGLVTLAVLFWILVNWYAFTQSVNIAISIISIRCGTTDGMYSEYNSHRSRMNVAPLSGECFARYAQRHNELIATVHYTRIRQYIERTVYKCGVRIHRWLWDTYSIFFMFIFPPCKKTLNCSLI